MRKVMGRGSACVTLAMTLAAMSLGQAAGVKREDKEVAATRAQVTALRDAFVQATVAAGLKCGIAPPAIVVEDVPTFGRYDETTNILTTSAWGQMAAEEKAFFYQLTGPGATEALVRAEFETDAHHWIFVHEMGHWWQECRHVTNAEKQYAYESGANRLAAAYWRERDPALLAHMRGTFAGVLANVPVPVPAGQDVVTYFDAHYPYNFGPSQTAYPWFQSRMSVAVIDEKPAPTFVEVLQQTRP